MDKLLADLFGESAKAEGTLGVGETQLGLQSLNIGGNAAANLSSGAEASRKTSIDQNAGQAKAILAALSYAGVI